MSQIVDEGTIQTALAAVLEDRVREAVEAEIEDVRERVEKRIRDQVGAIAASLFSGYSMERMGQDLVIRVQIGPKP